MVRALENSPAAAHADAIDAAARDAALERAHELVGNGAITLERFAEVVERVLDAERHAELESAMSSLPSPVRVTPASRRLSAPLVVRVPDGDLRLGAGWQLARETTVLTGFGSARLDLCAASWDWPEVNLHIATWGSVDVLVPRGVAVQIASASAAIRVESLAEPAAAGPLLRVSASGPTGHIRVRHPGTSPRPPRRAALLHGLRRALGARLRVEGSR